MINKFSIDPLHMNSQYIQTHDMFRERETEREYSTCQTSSLIKYQLNDEVIPISSLGPEMEEIKCVYFARRNDNSWYTIHMDKRTCKKCKFVWY